MKRRDLFKGLLGIAAGIVAAPFAKCVPKWEGTNVTRQAFQEVADAEKKVQASSGWTYSYMYCNSTTGKMTTVGPFSDET